MTVIVSGASRIMRGSFPIIMKQPTESSRRRQCGVEMRRCHQAIWRTVLPFTLSSDAPAIPRPPFVAVVVRVSSFGFPFLVRRRADRGISQRDINACGVAAITVFAFARRAWNYCDQNKRYAPMTFIAREAAISSDSTATTSVRWKLAKRMKRHVSFGTAVNTNVE